MSSSVSVILVNYNSGDCIRYCIDSLLRSNVTIQIIVVDNASTDRSLEYLESGSNKSCVEILFNKENRGFATAVNQGIQESKADYILVMNPDCIVEPETIRQMLVVIKSIPDAGMVGPLILNYDGTEQRGCRRKIPTPKTALAKVTGMSRNVLNKNKSTGFELHNSELPNEPTSVEAISGAFMLVSKEAVNKVGLMDEKYFMHCEDLDWCYRFSKAGYKIIFNPNSSILHYKGQSSRKRQIRVYWHMHRGMVRFFNKFYRKNSNIVMQFIIYLGIWFRFATKSMIVLVKWLGSLVTGTSIKKNLNHQTTKLTECFLKDIPSEKKAFLISGATSIVGLRLIAKLLKNDSQIVAISRKLKGDGLVDGVSWITPNPILIREFIRRYNIVHFVHLAPIWVLPEYLKMLGNTNIRKVISLSSTSVLSKTNSVDQKDRILATMLSDGEEDSRNYCNTHNMELVILRPTLIYGDPKDGNLSNIIRFVKWFGFYPIVGQGVGRRQPIHVDNVVDSCFTIMNSNSMVAGTYEISGGEVLSYKQMVTRIFRHLGKRPLVLSMPLGFFRICIDIVTKVGVFPNISPSMADRMNNDLCYDHNRATRDFGFKPGNYLYR